MSYEDGLKISFFLVALFGLCFSEVSQTDATVDQSCDPLVDNKWYPVKGDHTSFVFCSPSLKKYVKNQCPKLKGVPQYFDDETSRCFTPRSRMKRTPGVPKSSGAGEPCLFNTDCMDNMYCPSGRCLCNPGFVGSPNNAQSCIRALNPGQLGCINDIQCSGAWPGATCDTASTICQCPSPSGVTNYVYRSYDTQDGTVCVLVSDTAVAQGNFNTLHPNAVCPTPAGFLPESTQKLAEVQTVVTGSVADATARTACTYGATAVVPVNGAVTPATTLCNSPDIYDCIPIGKSATVGRSTYEDVGVCCPSRAMVCIQPRRPSAGGTITRYWYNSVTNLCEPFLWTTIIAGTAPGDSPKDANGNNFVTLEHCYSYCRGTCQRGAPRLNARAAATDPIIHVTQCTTDANCPAGNNNALPYTCKTTANPAQCCPTRAGTCSASGGVSYTTVPTTFDQGVSIATGGTLFSSSQRWYWSGTQCIQFTYGGREGNFNNFLSPADCQSYCGTSVCTQGLPLKDQNGNNQACTSDGNCPTTYTCRSSTCCPRPQTVCSQPKLQGTCTNTGQRYWYNANTRDCELFDYTGCGGNDNNFADYSTCITFCRDIRPQPRCIQGEAQKDGNGVYRQCSTDTGGVCLLNYECYFDGFQFGCCPTRALTCASNRDLGRTCITAGSRWYYNPTTKTCESFAYAGCDGNSNNFNNKDDCERYCAASGCPYGGQPFLEPTTNARRICSTTVTCGSGYECQNVLISNSPLSVCCLTRYAICTQNPIQGSTLGVATQRFYFNPSTRQCTQFTFYGTGGNENNFMNAAQCNNFCSSAACGLGETVLLDVNTQQPVSCNQQLSASCQIGYACRQDTLFNRFVCCGSTDMGVCPSGEKAFVEPLTLQPRECTASAVNQCPNNYLCRQNQSRNRNYCCMSVSGVLCPAGKAVLRDPITRQPRSCFQASTDQCQTTGYSCQPLVAGQSGYCCSNNALCPNGGDFLVDANQNPQACTIQVGVNPCGSGATCQPSTVGSTSGFCCRGLNPVGDGCPAGQSVLMINGIVQMCGGMNIAPFCPSQYTCVQNTLVTPARFQCCGTMSTTDPDGCGMGQIAFKDAIGAYRMCAIGQPGMCPVGFGCQQTSANQLRCCGTSGGCPANTVVQINPSTGSAQTCILGQPCSSNAYQCSQTMNGALCCSTNVIDTVTTMFPPTVSPARCPFSNQTPYINPATGTTVPCDPRVNTCPNAYACLNSGSGFICCQPLGGATQCPAGSTVALLGGQPQSCVGTTMPCPANYNCAYSTSFRSYYCCSGGTTVRPSNACPGFSTPYFTPGSRTPSSCTTGAQPGAVGACPGSYNCVMSPVYQTTICCTAFVGLNIPSVTSQTCSAVEYPNTKLPLNCGPNPSGCPAGSTCKNDSAYSHKVCCRNN